MSDCNALRENMPLLLTESLDPARRELTHQHIESCAECSEEWNAYRETWRVMDELPEVEVPVRVRERFLAAAGIAQSEKDNVVPFHRRPALKWLAQAAAVIVLVGGGYVAGHRTEQPGIRPTNDVAVSIANKPLSIAETRVVNASSISPDIQGRPNIANVQFTDPDATDNQIGLSFDITSRWTVTGNPKDKSMVRLLSYMLESESAIAPRSSTLSVMSPECVVASTGPAA